MNGKNLKMKKNPKKVKKTTQTLKRSKKTTQSHVICYAMKY
jgi:ribosomal protein L24E